MSEDVPNPASPSFQPRTTATRVVASKDQLTILNAFYARVEMHPTKDGIEEVSRQTGLETKWIRKWLSRRNHPRARNRSPSFAGYLPIRGSYTLTPIDVFAREPITSDATSTSSGQNNIDAVSCDSAGYDLHESTPLAMSASACRPEAFRSVSASELSSASSSLLEDSSSASNSWSGNSLSRDTRSLTSISSMGYASSVLSIKPLPVARPMLSSGSFLEFIDCDSQPQTQTLEGSATEFKHPDEETNTNNMIALIRLLEDTAASSSSSDLDRNPSSGAGQTATAPSFIPYMTSRPVSEPVTAPGPSPILRSWQPPPPICYKMHHSDLVTLTKKVRSAHLEIIENDETRSHEEGSIALGGNDASNPAFDVVATPSNMPELDPDTHNMEPDEDEATTPTDLSFEVAPKKSQIPSAEDDHYFARADAIDRQHT